MKAQKLARLMSVITGTTAILLIGSKSAKSITLTTFSPVGFSDAVAGITDFVIEDFEDTTLISGLSVEWISPDLGPVNTLPTTYNPSSQSFNGNPWDGTFTLNNTRQDLFGTPISSTTTLNFANQPTSVGLGISNLEFTGSNSSILVVNGVDFADFDTFIPAPILGAASRSVYIRLDANANETIDSIGIRGGVGDFLTFDRLAVNNAQSIPESSNVLGLFLVAGVTIFTGIKFKKKEDPQTEEDT